jgi:hypothetical protein
MGTVDVVPQFTNKAATADRTITLTFFIVFTNFNAFLKPIGFAPTKLAQKLHLTKYFTQKKRHSPHGNASLHSKLLIY